MINLANKPFVDWQDGLAGKSACLQAWWCEFNPRNLHSGRRELTPKSCYLHMPYGTNAPTPINKYKQSKSCLWSRKKNPRVIKKPILKANHVHVQLERHRFLWRERRRLSIHVGGNPRQVLTGLKLSMGAAEVHATLRIKIVCTLLKSRLTGSPAQSQNTYQEQFQF